MGELETDAGRTRSEIASTFASQRIDSTPGDVTLALGGKQVRPDPTDPVTFKSEGESDWSEGDTEAKRSIEFESVRWREARTPEEGTLDIGHEEG